MKENLSNVEKFEKWGVHVIPAPKQPDAFATMFDDKTLDYETAELLGWWTRAIQSSSGARNVVPWEEQSRVTQAEVPR